MATLSLDALIRPPYTLDDAVELLLNVLEPHELALISSKTFDDLIDLHFSVGQKIRNILSLHDLNNPLACFGNADDLSLTLIEMIWVRQI